MRRRRRQEPSAPRLYVHGVTAEEWTRRYGVTPFSHPCGGCGRVMTTTIPFAQGTLRGLQAPPCACGHHREPEGPDDVVSRPPYALVRDPKVGDLFDCGGRLDR